MFKLFKKLFGEKAGKPDPDSDQPSLRDMDIFIFAAMQDEGIDASELTQEKLLEQIRRSAEDLSKQQSFAPFIYEADGQRRLPFFSGQDYAQIFAGEYSKQRNRVYPFQLLGVKGSVLMDLLPACDVLVMNDGAIDAVVIPICPKS